MKNKQQNKLSTKSKQQLKKYRLFNSLNNNIQQIVDEADGAHREQNVAAALERVRYR